MSRQNENKASLATEVSDNNSNNNTEPTAPSADQETRSRRSMIGAGLAGLASAIVAACSGTDFASTGGANRLKGKKAKKNDENFDGGGQDGVDNDDAADGPDGGPGSGEAEAGETESGEKPKVEVDKCAATTPQKIDTTGMPSIENAPVVRFYGSRTSRMVAIQFSSTTTFDQLLIATATGRLLALHVPSGADRNASGWRPIVIDPLNFDEGGAESAEMIIILQQGNERKQHREAMKLFDKFEGKDVIDLSKPTAGSGWDHTKQSVARFLDTQTTVAGVKEYTGYTKDETPSLVYPGGRKLKTAQQNLLLNISTTVLSSGQKPIPTTDTEGKITDIMGNVLAKTDIENAGLLETPLFCTYRPTTDGTKFIRTIIYVA
jgi:hypothetical protein